MPITKETTLGELSGYYRTTLVAALKVYTKAVAKTRKDEDEIDGVTDHLDDKDEIVEEFKACLGAATSAALENTPLGRAMQDGAQKHAGSQLDIDEILRPDGVDIMDDSVITMMLEIVHYDRDKDVIADAVKEWARETRYDVYVWARAMQLAGDPTVSVKVPPRPAVVKVEWLSIEQLKLVEEGAVDPDTLEKLPEMSDEDVAHWIDEGPWGPTTRFKDTGNVFVLMWNGPIADGAEAPVYAFEHADEKDARHIAAAINRRIAHQRGDALPMPEQERERWLAIGPWTIDLIEDRASDDELPAWRLLWTEKTEEDVLPPTHMQTYNSAVEAATAAAELNKEVHKLRDEQPYKAEEPSETTGDESDDDESRPPTSTEMEEIEDAEALAKKKSKRTRKPKGGGSKGK